MNGGTVNHCKNKAQIKATTQDCDYLGGILGFNEDGYIKDCVNEGEIIGNNQIGGIAGENDGFDGKFALRFRHESFRNTIGIVRKFRSSHF